MDLNTRLAQIRELQGKDPLPNPGIIQGFESGSPSSPSFPADQDVPFEDDDDHLEVPESPLIPRRAPEYVVKQSAAPASLEPADGLVVIPGGGLVVIDGKASFRGFSVDLLDDERSAVSAVVVLALQRVLEGHMVELRVGLAVGVTPEEKQALTPKRRGRPRKDRA